MSDGTPVSRPRARLMVGQVERQSEQVVAQRAGDELVDLVADLPGHAADDRAGGDFIGHAMRGTADLVELERIEEAVDQADMIRR